MVWGCALAIPEETRNRLLNSLGAGNLIILTGAGLSIPGPSDLMSAVDVARHCYDEHSVIEQLPPAMRDDIDTLD